MDNEPNGRRLHHWIGKDRTADIAELADTIAAVGKLFNHDGVIVQLDPTGKLIQLNLAGLRAFIDQHICGVRLVALDNGWQWQRQYFTYQFEPRQRPNPMHWPPLDETEPDATVLDEIYWHDWHRGFPGPNHLAQCNVFPRPRTQPLPTVRNP